VTGRSLSVTGQSYVELSPGNPPCVIALNAAGAGVALSGGTRLSASGCAVASDASLFVPCGTGIVADTVEWDTTAPVVGCGGIQPYAKASVSVRQVKTVDPLATSSSVTAAVARLATVAAMSGPAAPSVSGGTSLVFGYSAGTSMPTGTACTATHAAYGGNWTVTCPAGGNYTFGSLTVGGGVTVNFDLSGSGSTYNFSGTVTNTGSALSFGAGTYNLAAGLLSTSGTTSFGSGTLNVGKLGSACWDGGTYSICNTSSLTVAGPVTVNLQAGLYNSGGETVSIGAGSSGNSYQFGPSSNGFAISVGGGSQTTLGDATSGLFQMVGNILASGGECITLPAASQHDIYGNITTAGGLVMGSGTYTVTSYIDIGGLGGGDVYCNGALVGVTALNSTLVIGAAHTPSDLCYGMAFCLGAGFGHVTITAPTSGTNANLAVIGPTNGSTAGASFGFGATSTVMSGAFYFPDGAMSMNGQGTISSGGQCLELIASQITLAGGSAAATVCPGLSGNPSTVVATLVQ
jgi:hypothetical protein